ncbi:MAG: YicC family protein [Gammaproteobacteria bacterium]|nr:YicC family protein [Gammaproteobacteria bacterium]MBT8075817.1 YicC family protein [Gammaproteobacteria bacterium]NNL00177.1 YicC family protein [Xanthomonadales bacterium]
MIRSMTGFARIERQYAFGRLSWEMRSVNHRYLDFSLRLAEEFRPLEADIRECLGQYLSRGKIEASLRFFAAAGSAGSGLELNLPLAHELLKVHGDMAGLAGAEQQPDIAQMLKWPGLIEEKRPDPAPLQAAAMDLLVEAAQELQAGRAREGEQMANAIRERLKGVAELTENVRAWLPEIRAGLKQRLLDRIADLPLPTDPGRIEQEVAFLIQKIDVDEELDRLDAHVEEVYRVLELNEPVGRRLDFLMQEFNRESNTLSSKSVDQRTTQAAVDLKVLIEQMREQVQNVE